MKKIFIVNGEEFKVGNIYSKADAKKFKEAENFNDIPWQLTPKKNTIVIAEELVDDKKKVSYKIEKELEYKEIFNSDNIAPERKLQYFNVMRDVNRDKYSILYDEAIKFFSNYKDLDFSLRILNSFMNWKTDLCIEHLDNILNNDSTGEYLKKINKLDYSISVCYEEKIVNRMFDIARESHDLSNLMSFMENILLKNRDSCIASEVDFYELLSLIDEYDKTGEYYVLLAKALPYFEVNHIQSKIIELAKVNKNCTYCVKFLEDIPRILFKSVQLNDLVSVIVEYWKSDMSSYFIDRRMFKYLSEENVTRLRDICNYPYRDMIDSFLSKNNTNI